LIDDRGGSAIIRPPSPERRHGIPADIEDGHEAELLSASDLRRRLVHLYAAAWKTQAAPRRGREGLLVLLLVAAVWAVASLPNLSLRAFIYEEGRNAALARDITARGDWLEPAIYGTRWAEKPALLPWATAAIAPWTGGVNEWSVRWPVMLSVLLTALLIQRLTRRYASLGASLFAAGGYLFCPLLLQKLTIAEPDTLVTALSFAAFYVWWGGEEKGRVGAGRWIAAALITTLLSLAKGPQPAGFFVLGIGVYILWRRRWRELPGIILAGLLPALANIGWGALVYRPGDEYNWLRYMRMNGQESSGSYLYERARFVIQLALEWLPMTLLLPFLANRRWRARIPLLSLPVVFPLLCYLCTGMALLLVWPGTGSRYAMPLTPAVCVLAAFTVQELWRRRDWLAHIAIGMLGLLALYQLLLPSIGVPLFADQFGLSRGTAGYITRAIRADPAPVYCAPPCDPTRLFYVEVPIAALSLHDLARLKPPAWLLTTRDVLPLYTSRRPDLDAKVVVERPEDPRAIAVKLLAKPATP
jgi:4-amino-4-deoxy-L-arabinose transferase-like glycosyltransferase